MRNFVYAAIVTSSLWVVGAAPASADRMLVVTHVNPGEATHELRLVSVRPDGSDSRVVRSCQGRDCGSFTNVSVGPGGRRIAVGGYGDSIIVGRPDGSSWRLLRLPAFRWLWSPSWSPDGRRLAFIGLRPRNGVIRFSGDVYTVRSDGTDIRRLTRYANANEVEWSRRGRLAFHSSELSDRVVERNSSVTAGIVTMDARGRSRRLAASGLVTMNPRWDPRGQWLYYETWSDGRVTLRRVHRTGDRREVFLPGVQYPVWSPSGRQMVVHRPTSTGRYDLAIADRFGRGVRSLDLALPSDWGQPMVLAWLDEP